jgi:hypothetical protein
MKRLMLTWALLAMPMQTPQGTGVIAGIVRNADGNAVLAKAQVSIEVVNSVSASTDIRPIVTDSSGRFVFANLPPGVFRLFATASGFVTREYGQQESNSPGTPISLATDQRLSNLLLQLVPVGTISGEVRTYDGLPAVKVTVKATRTLFTAAGKVQQIVKSTTADDRGKYRLFGLSPGPYYVSTGREEPPSSRSESDYSVQFYPGVDTFERGLLIDVTSGGELNVNLKTSWQKNVTVRGTIVDAKTERPPETVQWHLIYQPANGKMMGFAPEANYNPLTGEFELRGVWLGVYILEARTKVQDPAAADSTDASLADLHVARIPIVVQDAGLENLRLIQIPPFEVTGRVHVEGVNESLPMTGTVDVSPIDPQSAGRTPPSAKIAADGSFKISGLFPGEYMVRLQEKSGGNVYTKNITFDANDILNFPWHLTGPTDGSIEIVRRAGLARLTGTATTARNEPAGGAHIVLLPVARFRSDLYKGVTADRNGRFTMIDIAPGEYRLFAFESLAAGDEFNPDYMRVYEGQGYPIHIVESMANSRDIRTVPK